MDFGNTYATPAGERVVLYATDNFTVPDEITLRCGGKPVTFRRINPSALRCGEVVGVAGSCENPDCHRTPLRKCGCGRHEYSASGFVRRQVGP